MTDHEAISAGRLELTKEEQQLREWVGAADQYDEHGKWVYEQDDVEAIKFNALETGRALVLKELTDPALIERAQARVAAQQCNVDETNSIGTMPGGHATVGVPLTLSEMVARMPMSRAYSQRVQRDTGMNEDVSLLE